MTKFAKGLVFVSKNPKQKNVIIIPTLTELAMLDDQKFCHNLTELV